MVLRAASVISNVVYAASTSACTAGSGGIANAGTMSIYSSTIAYNVSHAALSGAGGPGTAAGGGISNAAFDMPVGRSLPGLIVVSIAMGLAATSMGMMIASLSKTDKQADTIGTLQGFVLGALGGCIVMGSPVPLYNQGGTIETISRLTPHAHALMAYGKLLNQNMGLVDVLPQVGILLLFTLVFLLIAVWRFRFE